MRQYLVIAACVASSVAGVSCATTYDASRAPSTAAVTTTTEPTGAVEDLLVRLGDTALGLSTVMIEGGDSQAVAAQIAALWAAARPEVQARRPDLIEGFDINVAKCTTAVQFKRAADADKAARNLQALVAATLG